MVSSPYVSDLQRLKALLIVKKLRHRSSDALIRIEHFSVAMKPALHNIFVRRT